MEEVAEKYDGQYPIDMHFVSLTLQDYYYAKMNDKASLNKCKVILHKDMDIYSAVKEAYLKEHKTLPRYPAFKLLFMNSKASIKK